MEIVPDPRDKVPEPEELLVFARDMIHRAINYYGHVMGRGPGRGKGSGRGSRRGMGYRHGNNPGNVRFDVTDAKLHKQHVRKEDEIKWLKSEAESLRRAQTDIENRLNDLQHKSE